MVATVLKLRYRVLGNTLARRPWQLVGFIFGGLWGLSILASLVAGLVALSIFEGLEAATLAAVLGGSILILGWFIGPVLVAGLDSTVDAVRLAPFPLTRRQVMLALAGCGVTGIPGIVTTVAVLASVILWLRWPLAAVVAVPTVLLGVLTCVLATRLMSELSGGLGGRRTSEVIGTVALLLVILAGPILSGGIAVLTSAGGDFWSLVQRVAAILPWTPLGAAWAVAPRVATGEWLAAGGSLAIAVATIALLWFAWGRVLETSTSSPRQRSTRSVAAGTLGLFGIMPTGGVGATWARSLNAWLRDPRYLRQLILLPIFPVLFAFTGGLEGVFFIASPVLAAFVLSATSYSDVSYDGTAFGTTLQTGITGRADRWGRLLGAACVGIPLIVLISVVTSLLSGRIDLLPAVLGASLALVLAGYGACAVSSAYIVSPVAAPGDSPFKSVPGQNAVTGLLMFAVWAVVMVIASPSLVLAVVAVVTDSATWAWLSLALGIVLGAAVVVIGVFVGGRALDREGPQLLQRIKAFPTS